MEIMGKVLGETKKRGRNRAWETTRQGVLSRRSEALDDRGSEFAVS
jgi:hypothetical protein